MYKHSSKHTVTALVLNNLDFIQERKDIVLIFVLISPEFVTAKIKVAQSINRKILLFLPFYETVCPNLRKAHAE